MFISRPISEQPPKRIRFWRTKRFWLFFCLDFRMKLLISKVRERSVCVWERERERERGKDPIPFLPFTSGDGWISKKMSNSWMFKKKVFYQFQFLAFCIILLNHFYDRDYERYFRFGKIKYIMTFEHKTSPIPRVNHLLALKPEYCCTKDHLFISLNYFKQQQQLVSVNLFVVSNPFLDNPFIIKLHVGNTRHL